MTRTVDEREARRRYVRRRQTVVFSIVAVVLAAAMVIASAFYFHLFGLGEIPSPQVKPNYGVTVPCAPKDQDGNTSTYVDSKEISIRVLNGTTSSGLAKAVGNALQNRDFTLKGISTGSKLLSRTTIYFGAKTIAQAYTLQSNFTDAVMVMDDRTDNLIDVVVGATFSDLRDKQDVPGTGQEIKSFQGCVAADKMPSLPKALQHDPA